MHPPFHFAIADRPASVNNRGPYYSHWMSCVRWAASSTSGCPSPPDPNLCRVDVVHFHRYGRFSDVDNILKATLDGMTGVVYTDDSNVEMVTSRRLRAAFHTAIPAPTSALPAIAAALSFVGTHGNAVAVRVDDPPGTTPADLQRFWP